MARIPGFATNITGASGTAAALTAKSGWRAFVLPRGAYAASDSTGTLITFDSADVISGFTVGDWIQAGLPVANIRQVGSIGGNSLNVSGAALTVSENTRIYLIGSSEPTVTGGSATYTPRTTIRQRDDDAADVYTNSMITSNSDGLIQGFGGTGVYDVLVQDGNQTNQGSIIDLAVGVVEGISTSSASVFGATVTFLAGVSMNTTLVVGQSATFNGPIGITGWATFGSTVTMHAALGVTGNATFGQSLTVSGTLHSKRGPGAVRYASEFATGSTTGGIQDAINDLPAVGGIVMLDGGATYQPTVAITLGSSLTIDGHGATIQRTASLDALSIFKDAGSAISKVTIRNVVFDNNSRAATAEDILLTGGCTDISVDGCRWINLTGRTEDLTRVATSASKGARIAWRNNTVVGPGSQQTYNSFQIFDCDNVSVTGNIIDGWGAIKLEGSLAANLYNWNISNNVMKNVAQTNIFCRIQSASSVTGVCVSDNSITDSGKTGMAVGAINAGDTGTIADVSISGNVIRGFALSLADSGIALGGNVTSGTYYMTNVAVSGNIVNGLDSTGAQPADQNRGIQFSSGIAHFSCTGNAVRNCGRDGIATLGVRDGTISGNLVERCVKQDTTASAPTPAQEGGITIYTQGTYATKKIVIANNVSKNNGVGGSTVSYGINLGPNTGALKATGIVVSGNICYDDQATKTQDYGIIIGSAGNQGPDDSVIQYNDLRGNSSGGILGPLGTASGIYIFSGISTSSVNLTQAASLAITDGNVFGVSGTLGAGTSISAITPVTQGREIMLWSAMGTMGFSVSNTLRVVGNSINVPVNGAVKAFCTGTTWFVFSPSS